MLTTNSFSLKKYNSFFYNDIYTHKYSESSCDSNIYIDIKTNKNNLYLLYKINKFILYMLFYTNIAFYKHNFNKIKEYYNPDFSEFSWKLYTNTMLNSYFWNYSTLALFRQVTFNRYFAKLKVQKKKNIFFKNVINIDIFNKKLNNINNSFTYNAFIYNNKNIFSKLHLFAQTLNKEKSFIISNIFFSIFLFQPYLYFYKKINTVYIYTKIKKSSNRKNTSCYIFNFKKNSLSIKTNVTDKKFIYNIMDNTVKGSLGTFNNFSNYNVFNNLRVMSRNKPYNYSHKTKYYYNNFLPIYDFFLKRNFIKSVLLRNNNKPSFVNYYVYYLTNFLEIFLKRKIWLKINSDTSLLIKGDVSSILQSIFIKNKNEQSAVGRHFYLLEFLEIIFIAFYYRDMKMFSYWLKKTMEKIHLKKHKKFLRVIHTLLKNNDHILSLCSVNGFMMDVRGKLSSTGNSKKKHYAFTIGSMSPTSRDHDMVFNQTTVRTSTGVLGVSITLSF